MTDLAGAKIGDTLYIWRGHYDQGRLETVERVTSSGRVFCRSGAFNPNGTIRGGSDRWLRTGARIATDADIARVRRYELASRLRSQIDRQWDAFTMDELNAMAAISDAVKARTAKPPPLAPPPAADTLNHK